MPEIDTKQISFLHPKLQEVLSQLEEKTGLGFTITSMYRSGDRGVHATIPLRAVDIRCRDESISNAIANLLNLRYQYDPDRPDLQCAIYHDAGRGAHLHLQVHPNTVPR